MLNYYRMRAPEYDLVYRYPERQTDLRYLETYIAQYFSNLDVLEIAAGTGYWSQFIAASANTLLATDANKETLAEILKRPRVNEWGANINIRVIDAYKLEALKENYNGLFAGFWFSHVPVVQRQAFFDGIHQVLAAQSKVLLIDNSIAQCDRLPISREDTGGNSYQRRTLEDGSEYEVLKNFPTENELRSLTNLHASNQRFQQYQNFWLFEYEYNP